MKSSVKRIVLHCGLPKTGTTALQHWCHQNREELLRHGIDYPFVDLDTSLSPRLNDRTPKHGFLVSSLRNDNMKGVRQAIENSPAPTLLLSTEGLSNHFYSFTEDSLRNLRAEFGSIPVDLFLCVRNKEKWLRSLWKEGVIAFPGTTLGFSEYCALPAIRALSDWPKLAKDMTAAFGAREFRLVALEDNGWKEPLLDFLHVSGMQEVPDTQDQFNVSVSNELIGVLRHLNKQRLEPATRLMFLSLAQEKFRTSHLTFQNAYDWASPNRAQLLEIKTALKALGPLPKPLTDLRNQLIWHINKTLREITEPDASKGDHVTAKVANRGAGGEHSKP